jgi:hypothetical protein
MSVIAVQPRGILVPEHFGLQDQLIAHTDLHESAQMIPVPELIAEGTAVDLGNIGTGLGTDVELGEENLSGKHQHGQKKKSCFHPIEF